MPIISRENLFLGVNPLLNSFLQQPNSSWKSFHFDLISKLKTALTMNLPNGYYAIAEHGLHIREIGLDVVNRRHNFPDLSLYHEPAIPPQVSTQSKSNSPTTVLPLGETLLFEAEENDTPSIAIYEMGDNALHGKLVTAIEILSPANKPPSAYHGQHIAKRIMLLQAGIHLVEIDLLHEQRPVWNVVPSYRQKEKGSYPYLIAISDPVPTAGEGSFELYGIAIDQKLPVTPIPLSQNMSVEIDMQEVYNNTYLEIPILSRLMDYSENPVNFKHYHKADQARILEMLEIIRNAPA